ncbi:MAG: hypothetical protein AB7E47_12940 [Desulfovibrionaceae bacterium]
MRLTCPACGAQISWEAALSDADGRQAMVLAMRLPERMGALVPRYLALFRPPGSTRGLAWRKVRRLLEELVELTGAPDVTWKHKAPREISQIMWAQALETLLEKADAGALDLPLESHGYLRAIAYGVANDADAQAERGREKERQYRDDQPAARLPRPSGAPDLLEQWKTKQKTKVAP